MHVKAANIYTLWFIMRDGENIEESQLLWIIDYSCFSNFL